MKKRTLCWMAAVMLAAGVAEARSPVHPFNGKNLKGWVGYVGDSTLDAAEEFGVVDGMLRVSGALGYIRTTRAYSDYRLTLQYRWEGEPTNSGIFMHIQPGEDRLWPKCYECQLWAGHAGDVNDAGDSQSDEFRRIGAATVPKLQPASERPAGEWNDVEIVCDGNSMTIFINGVLQNKLTRMNNDHGYNALEGEGSPILFRNIEVAPLKRKR